MESRIEYSTKLAIKRGKVYLTPASDAHLRSLKKASFRAGGLLFAETCQILRKRVRLDTQSINLAKLNPFAFLMGDIGLPVKKPGAGRTKAAKRVIVLDPICIDIRCRGYRCTTTVRKC